MEPRPDCQPPPWPGSRVARHCWFPARWASAHTKVPPLVGGGCLLLGAAAGVGVLALAAGRDRPKAACPAETPKRQGSARRAEGAPLSK